MPNWQVSATTSPQHNQPQTNHIPIAGVFFTGGSLNPARSFGPDVVTATFDGYHWIYWLGPALGSLLAVVIYRVIKMLEYETANPGQDFDENEIQAIEDIDDPETADEVRRPPVASPTMMDRESTTVTPP